MFQRCLLHDTHTTCNKSTLYNNRMFTTPEAELIAKYSGINVAEGVLTNSSPDSVADNFQASFVRHSTS